MGKEQSRPRKYRVRSFPISSPSRPICRLTPSSSIGTAHPLVSTIRCCTTTLSTSSPWLSQTMLSGGSTRLTIYGNCAFPKTKTSCPFGGTMPSWSCRSYAKPPCSTASRKSRFPNTPSIVSLRRSLSSRAISETPLCTQSAVTSARRSMVRIARPPLIEGSLIGFHRPVFRSRTISAHQSDRSSRIRSELRGEHLLRLRQIGLLGRTRPA